MAQEIEGILDRTCQSKVRWARGWMASVSLDNNRKDSLFMRAVYRKAQAILVQDALLK